MSPGYERLNIISFALGDHLYAPVRQVAHPSPQPKLHRLGSC